MSEVVSKDIAAPTLTQYFSLLSPAQIKRQARNQAFKLAHPDYNAEYYQANKEELKARSKKYRQEHKQEIVQYRKDNEVRNNAYAAKYFIDNIERITTTHQCECGGRYSLHHKARHEKTNLHIKSLEIA